MKASGGVLAFVFNADVAYQLTNQVSLIASNQLINRADVVNKPIRYSFFGGIKLYFKD
jgi:hypothetical protein